MFDYNLALMTGADIAIPELEITLHQPSIKEISMVGEHKFFIGIQMLCIDKTCISEEEVREKTTNFEVFLTLITQKNMADKKEAAIQVLSLILPEYIPIFTPRSIVLKCNDTNIIINEENFEIFQKVLKDQFCLSGSGQEVFNPKGKKAQAIAEKLMKARQKVAEQGPSNSNSIFNQYLSVLTVGISSMSLSDLVDLTMYQLFDLIERYQLYMNWDIDIRSRMAGAKVDTPVENWMKQIH